MNRNHDLGKMTDYYKELNLDQSKTAQEISKDLLGLEIVWKRREVTNPEKATAKLALILEGKKVFFSEESRSLYDHTLALYYESVQADNKSDESWNYWYNTALQYYSCKKYDMALVAINKSLNEYSPDEHKSEEAATIYQKASLIHRKNDSLDNAMHYINLSLLYDANNASSYSVKGEIYRALIESEVLRKSKQHINTSSNWINNELFEHIDQFTDLEIDCYKTSLQLSNLQSDHSSKIMALRGLSFAYYYYSKLRPYLDDIEVFNGIIKTSSMAVNEAVLSGDNDAIIQLVGSKIKQLDVIEKHFANLRKQLEEAQRKQQVGDFWSTSIILEKMMDDDQKFNLSTVYNAIGIEKYTTISALQEFYNYIEARFLDRWIMFKREAVFEVYNKINEENRKLITEQINFRKANNLCPYCGGKFSGIINPKCMQCGKKKDYNLYFMEHNLCFYCGGFLLNLEDGVFCSNCRKCRNYFYSIEQGKYIISK